ncbi:MAG: undecaprenyl/decaprenyl-phosphate alpha-N-acetylglucosaminyl 1-phosphate transferase [Ezakiella sp.]|nr:undecaprenyl/decaprenyl-phosphate alpha-N-acetylglucosaminyl 1-phosphate transferase [Ezakiella sp.]MDD7472435.1 MraY family glycosyltransferase [Bacillota bacterium]MDY3923169.1 MraY family glycosyltransferase [Ezakiella sp.]
MNNFYIFMLAFCITFALTPINIYLSKKFGFVDIPKDNRRMHNKPIATIGGIGIFVSFLLVVLMFLDLNRKIISILIGSAILVITGIIDDKIDIRPRVKLLLQIIAAVVVVLGGVKVNQITNPFKPMETFNVGFLGIIFTIIWIVGVSNALNFIDGLDGLCAGLATISALTFYFAGDRAGVVPMMALALAGSTLGFLPYNFNPAKIFMGDTGSLPIGFILACLSIEGVMKSVTTMSLIVPILILALPVFDTLFAIFRRAINGKKIMEADKGHLHHRLIERGYSVKSAVLIMYGLSITCSLMGLLISQVPPEFGMVLSALTIIMIVVLAMMFGLFKKENKPGSTGIH